jgi:hypothetical protein
MSLKYLKNEFDKYIESSSDKLIDQFLSNTNFMVIAKPTLRKIFRKMLFANINIIILIEVIRKIDKNPSLSKIINTQMEQSKNLNRSLILCENCINTIWEELYKILY